MAMNVIPGYGGYGAFHSYDLTTPQGLRLLIERTATDARMAIEARWEQGLAGVSPQQLADELTDDFMCQSQSLPRGAFREDPPPRIADLAQPLPLFGGAPNPARGH